MGPDAVLAASVATVPAQGGTSILGSISTHCIQ
jgi:hypothetical protein